MAHRKITLPVMAALGAVYFFWGTTYLGMKFAIETIPPLTMLGMRFGTAGALLYAYKRLRGLPAPTSQEWRGASRVGALMLLGGTGGVVWAEQFVPSNIAAIIIATVPLWILLIRWLIQREGRPGGLSLAGILLGFSGIVLLVASTGSLKAGGNWIGQLALVIAALLWATGSLYSRVATLPKAPLLAISMQMLAGGLFCFVAGGISGEWALLNWSAISLRSLLALAWLVTFGSLVGFSCYIWLLKAADPTLVSTYAYVNPVVAVSLGWFLAGESLNAGSLVATAVIVFSVILITRGQTAAGVSPQKQRA